MSQRASLRAAPSPGDPRVECRFCHGLRVEAPPPTWIDEPIYETDSFVVLPSVGALVEGWMLVLPREHFINASCVATSLRNEFAQVVDHTISVVADEFGPPTVFEHGPSSDGSRLGCGVDHAHVHVVPLPFNLEDELLVQSGGLEWSSRECHMTELPPQSRDYLALSMGSSRTLLAFPEVAVSQFFRRRIAAALGRPEDYDYRSHPFLEKVATTRCRLLSGSAWSKNIAVTPASSLLIGVESEQVPT